MIDPSLWIDDKEIFPGANARAISYTRQRTINQSDGYATMGCVTLVVTSRMKKTPDPLQNMAQVISLKVAVASNDFGSALWLENAQISQAIESNPPRFQLLKVDKITMYKTNHGTWGTGLYVSKDFPDIEPLKRTRTIMMRAYPVQQDVEQIVQRNAKRWQASNTQMLNGKVRLESRHVFDEIWPTIRDVTTSVHAMERALIEERMERSKLQVVSKQLMNNHIWELDIVEAYYLGLNTTEKRSVADYLLTRNAAIMLIVEENKAVTKMFDAMVLDTIYEARDRQEDGVTKTMIVPCKLKIRRQITFFGGKTAGKTAEEQEGETQVPSKAIETMDGAVQLSESDDEDDDYYRDDDVRQQFDEANGEKPVFNLRKYDTTARIDPEKYNRPNQVDEDMCRELYFADGASKTNEKGEEYYPAKLFIIPNPKIPGQRSKMRSTNGTPDHKDYHTYIRNTPFNISLQELKFTEKRKESIWNRNIWRNRSYGCMKWKNSKKHKIRR